MTNPLNYNAGVWGGWAIMASMLAFHIGRIIWRKHKRTRRLMRMVERSVKNGRSR